jgi:hypothetical protein
VACLPENSGPRRHKLARTRMAWVSRAIHMLARDVWCEGEGGVEPFSTFYRGQRPNHGHHFLRSPPLLAHYTTTLFVC